MTKGENEAGSTIQRGLFVAHPGPAGGAMLPVCLESSDRAGLAAVGGVGCGVVALHRVWVLGTTHKYMPTWALPTPMPQKEKDPA